VTPHLVETARVPPPRTLDLPPGVLAPIQRGLWKRRQRSWRHRALFTAPLRRDRRQDRNRAGDLVRSVLRLEQLPWHQRNHAWFGAYAPAERPELVVVVFVEHGGQGSRAAAPIARALYAHAFGPLPDGIAPAS
jgi:hypothetical protein